MKVCLCTRNFCYKIPWQDYRSVLLVGIGVLGIFEPVYKIKCKLQILPNCYVDYIGCVGGCDHVMNMHIKKRGFISQERGDSTVLCPMCSKPTVIRHAKTEKKNKKPFYACENKNCKYFVRWKDSNPVPKQKNRDDGSGLGVLINSLSDLSPISNTV